MSDPIVTIDTQPVSALKAIGTAVSFSVTAHQDQAATLIYQWYKDTNPILGATSSTLSFSSIKAEDSNVYWCLITCSVGANSAKTNYVVLASSILDNIELQMKVLILGMTKANGFNFDWIAVNQEDEAINKGYPRALIESPQENNLDVISGAGDEAYTNEVLFNIYVRTQQTIDSTPNPNFTIRSLMRLAVDDLKMLFGKSENRSVNDSCDSCMYRGSLIMETNKNDVSTPAVDKTQWRVVYSQSRTTPLTYASN